MRRLKNGFWRAGLLVGLVSALALAAVGCGGDEQSESVAQQQESQAAAEQQAVQQQVQPQQQTHQAQAEAQPVAEQQEAQRTDSAAESVAEQQQSEPQAASLETTATQSGEQEEAASQQSVGQQAAAQQQSQQQSQQAQQAMEPESVPEGTRLISLFGDITEIVYALDAEEILVARDASSIYPRVAEALPNLGFAGALNAEAILEFEPTLVIGTPMAGPLGVLEQLEQAGVEVLILDDLNGLDAAQIKIRIIGETLGLPQRAEELALDVEKRLEAVMATAGTDKPLRVLHVYIRRGGLQLVSGEGNKAQVIIEAAGGIDAAAEAGIVGWQPLTPEALVAADPDVYLVMDRGLEVIDGIEGLLAIPGMAETKAGRGPHIISMPDLYLLGFGPRLPEAIADLTKFLQSVQAETLNE